VQSERRGIAAVRAHRPSTVYPWGVPDHPPVLLTDDTRVVLSPQQLSCDLAGEAAIVNLTTGVYFGVDTVGARVWNLMREETTFGELRASIAAVYAVQPDRLELDLRAFLHQLADHGLIEIR
jgi:hypothetical protein